MIQYLWAKSCPYQSLYDHSVQTGVCAMVLLRDGVLQPSFEKITQSLCIPSEQALNLLAYFAAIHDIGKCHPLFQLKDPTITGLDALYSEGLLYKGIPTEQVTSFRHEKYTICVLKRIWSTFASKNPDLWVALEYAISLHHQGKHGDAPRIRSDCHPKDWEDLQDRLNTLLLDRFQPHLDFFQISDDIDAVVIQIMGLIILSDWIASDSVLNLSELTNSMLDDHVRATIAARGLLAKDIPFCPNRFTALWPTIPEGSLRGIQETAETLGEKPDLLYLLEAPMGEGKSEAALYLAVRQLRKYAANGFYMALPTSASSNQMYERINVMLRTQSTDHARLLHATAWMIDEPTPDNNAISSTADMETVSSVLQWLSPLRRGLLSQFAVGTVDQAMLSVLMVRYGVLRLLGLSGKVLILDEIHAYDTYMQTIIERLLSWCRALSIPVILLSATLPQEKKRSLLAAYGGNASAPLSSSYPLITSVSHAGDITQTTVPRVHMKRNFRIVLHPYFDDIEQTAVLADNLTQNGGCICVLVNTVKKAQKVFLALKALGTGADVMLFHARFPALERQEIETDCVSLFGKDTSLRRSRCILVSTQVLEQSIDVDFDALITDLAPIDLLLQRMGRIHRFDGIQRPDHLREPQIHVMVDPKGNYIDQYIYASLLMKRTEALLRNLPLIETPSCIRECVEQVYSSETPEDEKEFEQWAKQAFERDLDSAKAEGVLLNQPNPSCSFLSQSVPSVWLADEPLVNRSARTRLGDGSRMIVLAKRSELPPPGRLPDRKTAKRLLEKSVSIRTTALGDPPVDAIPGAGLLKGVLLLPTEDGRYRWGKSLIWNDPELGTMIEMER